MAIDPTTEVILILDFGAQYSQLIARRVRECSVYCELVPFSVPLDEIRSRRPAGIILSGGPSSVYAPGAPEVDPDIFNLGVPVLGICYGHQAMAAALGGAVVAGGREYGKATLTIRNTGDLLCDTPREQQCWMSHGDTVVAAPPGFEILATTPSTPVAAMSNELRRLYGVQYHPEVGHTPYGLRHLNNFVNRICGCSGTWSAGSFIESAVEQIRNKVRNESVVCGVSGGVDSCVVAALVHKAIGNQLTCIFIDHGMLRAGEAEQVRSDFASAFGIHLVSVEARDRFLSGLAGTTDPEVKRKFIGGQFIREFEVASKEVCPDGAPYLAQGTLYPDVIESGTPTAANIKTHHNVGGLPADMRFKLLEPLRFLFKDEVRRVGEELGLPESIVHRHPFPGPGLAIRILGEVTQQALDTVRAADSIFIEEIRRAGLYREIWQAFAALAANVHSVGVMGDARTYANPIILRAVTSEDAMTGQWARIPYELLDTVSNRIVNEVPGVNRVVYDVTSKPPGTIEWE